MNEKMTKQSQTKKIGVKQLTVCAVLIALAFVINNFMPKIAMPFGGSATIFSMFIIFLPSYLYGIRVGLIAAFAFGCLDLLIGPSIVHPVQVLLDYPLAYGMLGLGGIMNKHKNGLQMGYLISIIGRFVMVALSGMIFWAEYTPEGWNFIMWSLVYNGTYIGIEGLITLVLLFVPQIKNMINKIKTLA